MDKNIAALLREDAHTVHVLFPYDNGGLGESSLARNGAPKMAGFPNDGGTANQWEDGRPLYTYVTNLPLKPEDYVVVPARGQFKLAMVKRVDAAVEIEPNSDMAYAWVVGVVDMANHDANIERNKEIEQTVGKAYNEIIGGVAGPAARHLRALLKGPQS